MKNILLVVALFSLSLVGCSSDSKSKGNQAATCDESFLNDFDNVDVEVSLLDAIMNREKFPATKAEIESQIQKVRSACSEFEKNQAGVVCSIEEDGEKITANANDLIAACKGI